MGDGSCLSDLAALAESAASGSLNAIEILQSSGAGFGHLGNYVGCLGSLGAHYCLIKESTPDAQQPKNAMMGLCLPDSCTEEMIQASADQFIPFLGANATIIADCDNTIHSDAGTLATYILLFMLAFLVFVCSAMKYVATLRKGTDPDEQQALLNGDSTPNYKAVSLQAKDDDGKLPKPRQSPLMKLVDCFDISNNIQQLGAPLKVEAGLRVLDGMRFLSMCWVILGHSLLWMIIGDADNSIFMLRNLEASFPMQIVVNGTFSVDTFFFLSGFLATFLMLKSFKKKGKSPESAAEVTGFSLKVYLARYLRLTPLYGVMLLIWIKLFPSLTYGPFAKSAYEGGDAHVCADYWWTNILYINNMYPDEFGRDAKATGFGCMGWTWYLANDFQMFLLVPLLAILMYNHRKIGLATMAAFLIACVVSNGVITHDFHIDVCTDFGATNLPDSQTLLYDKPWTRLSPYILGNTLGYVYHMTSTKQWTAPRFNLILRVFVVLTGVALLAAPVFSPYGSRHTSGVHKGECVWGWTDNFMYQTFSRFCWSLGLFITLFACLHGMSPIVTGLLSHRIFTVPSRLVFAAYLVHPMIMTLHNDTANRGSDYTDLNFVLVFFGYLACAFIAAVPLHLLIEAPTRNLAKLALS